jgi:hypothetical protein
MAQRKLILFAALVVSALAGAVAQQPAAAGFRNAGSWWGPGDGKPFPRELDYPNATGVVRTLVQGGEMPTKGHPFFSPIGGNGRACVTCHQPADAMALSTESIAERWAATGGSDPVFAAVDGSNCPELPQAERASHSLLIDHGLIRIERDWPVRDAGGRAVAADFRIETVRDPNGCNSGEWGPGGRKGKISVYRRPRPATNLKYLTAIGFAYDPKDGMPLDIDPATGAPASGNLTADARVLSLESQARDAMRTHLGLAGPVDEAAVSGIVAFQLRVSTAQALDNRGGRLDDGGAFGGPGHLEASKPGQLGSIGRAVWSEFEAWENIPADANLTADQRAFRESVARGARVFRDKTFLISDSAGINSPIGFGNPVRNSCVFCHNMSQMGNDVAPGQVDIGTTTHPFADPQPWLPLFRVTCLADPHPHYGKVIYTNDPGYALTTGKCSDVGKITLQSMRGLAARAPYFSNGSARTLRDIVEFYERRYKIGYSEQEKQDLVNLMSVL